jgi:uncharacterized OsmC-like protein
VAAGCWEKGTGL